MTSVGKVLGVFTSWPRNWFELTRHWLKGDISEVYKNYEKQSGQKVYSENWFSRHRAAMTYAAIYMLSMYAEKKTDIKATQYTGFKTIETIPNYLAGNIAGLKPIAGLAEVAVGTMSRNKVMTKRGLKKIDPTKLFLAVNKIRQINKRGKKTRWDSISIGIRKS